MLGSDAVGGSKAVVVVIVVVGMLLITPLLRAFGPFCSGDLLCLEVTA